MMLLESIRSRLTFGGECETAFSTKFIFKRVIYNCYQLKLKQLQHIVVIHQLFLGEIHLESTLFFSNAQLMEMTKVNAVRLVPNGIDDQFTFPVKARKRFLNVT